MYWPAHSKNDGKLGTFVWPPSCCRQANSPPRSLLTAGVLSGCQGTPTVTRLRDTNLYEENRQPRTVRGDLRILPVPP